MEEQRLTAQSNTPGLADALAAGQGTLVAVSLVKGFGGTVSVWAWLLQVLLCAELGASAGGLSGFAVRLCAAIGLVMAGAAFAFVKRVFKRGPEFNRRGMTAATTMAGIVVIGASALAAAGGDAASPHLIGALNALAAAGWTVEGMGAAYALRRSLLLLEAYSENQKGRSSVKKVIGLLALAAALSCLAVSRMDALGALVATCSCVPIALALLPQGRPVLGSRETRAWTGSSDARVEGRLHGPASPSAGEPVPAASPAGAYEGDNAAAQECIARSMGDARPDGAAVSERDAGSSPVQAAATCRDREAYFNDLAVRHGLSEREHDLLFLLADGLNAQQIADRAYVSRNTAKTHMAHIYAKFNIHSRAELDRILKGGSEQ